MICLDEIEKKEILQKMSSLVDMKDSETNAAVDAVSYKLKSKNFFEQSLLDTYSFMI